MSSTGAGQLKYEELDMLAALVGRLLERQRERHRVQLVMLRQTRKSRRRYRHAADSMDQVQAESGNR
jgi:hypothetical protein